MQKGAAAAESLVRIPATTLYANQPRSIGDPNNIDSDAPHKPPTPKQKAALNELLFFDNDKVLTWLTLLRSIEPGYRHRARGGYISSQQLDALSTLEDCDDSDILAWRNLDSPASQ